jgi:hypothetical protein
MAIRRLPGPPEAVVEMAGNRTLYKATLNTPPTRVWRAAFFRPPRRLISARYTPELGRLGLHEATVHFRTAPDRARLWLKRIDRWITYANSVVEE